MAARLRAVGVPDSGLHLAVQPSHPRDGNLVAILPGSDPTSKAILLLAHSDVAEANRDDWARDPFTLAEEKGFFYARGASKDKAQAAIRIDTLARFKRGGFRPSATADPARRRLLESFNRWVD
ncbi:MAG TPA: M20/M25/M40 family metallo-hydrolase [Allosphingosinicella sp.]|jgi:acetylornithine deacetylase/succinyl-diaminopimelate desuccinylase-like protein